MHASVTKDFALHHYQGKEEATVVSGFITSKCSSFIGFNASKGDSPRFSYERMSLLMLILT